MKETVATLTPATIDSPLLRETFGLCYAQLHGQGLLNGFQIRRLKFLRQDYERNLLWMVVAITISGVFLAALQLLGSYRLAMAGRGAFDQTGEIALARDQISLKSSITGLFILVVSFAFFAVFVFGIFQITEVDIDSGAKNRDPRPTSNREWGDKDDLSREECSQPTRRRPEADKVRRASTASASKNSRRAADCSG